MKLVLLGTSGYHPNERRHTSCYLIPELGIVLDAGTGMFRLPRHLATRTLDLFLSHAHLDHVVGLTYLLGLLYDRAMERVTIHGEAEKLAAVKEHLYATAIFPVPPAYEFRPLEIGKPGALACGGAKVTAFAVEHPGGCVGFRFDWPGRSLAYVTDTTARPDAPYLQHVRGVDLLLHECNFPDSLAEFAAITGHSHTSQVARLAKAAGVKRLVLTHVLPNPDVPDPVGLDIAQAIFPATELGEDNGEVEI